MKDRTDNEILDWLADNSIIEGLDGVRRDLHEIAFDLLESPIVKTYKKKLRERAAYRLALRVLISEAMDTAAPTDGEEEAR